MRQTDHPPNSGVVRKQDGTKIVVFDARHDAKLEQEIAKVTREVERFRRKAHEDTRFVPQLVGALCRLARLRFRKGEPERSERLNREALLRSEEVEGEVPAECLFRVHSQLAYHYDEADRLQEAITHYESALRYVREAGLAEPVRIAVIHNNLAMSYKRDARMDEAERSYFMALSEFQRGLNGSAKSDPRVASVYNNLAVLYYSREEYRKAFVFHSEALDIRSRLVGKPSYHYDLRQSFNNLAAVHRATGNYQKAAEYFAKVEELECLALATQSTTASHESSESDMEEVLVGQS